MRRLSLALLLIALAACGSTPEPGPAPRVELASIPLRHHAQLQALQAAIADDEDETAAHILRSLNARMEAERLAGAADLEGAVQLMEGFTRILEGRRILGQLDLRLEVSEREGRAAVGLVLRGDTSTVVPVVLRPGGATLRVEYLFAEPSGEMVYTMRQMSYVLEELQLSQGSTFERELGEFPIQLGPGTIAGRTTWTLDLTAGFVEREGERYPAQRTTVGFVDRIELRAELPNEPLIPDVLADAVLDPRVGMAGVMERCVRIHPREYATALDALAPLVARATNVEVSDRLAPCLRWLSRGSASGADPGALRRWAAAWSRRERGARSAADGLDI